MSFSIPKSASFLSAFLMLGVVISTFANIFFLPPIHDTHAQSSCTHYASPAGNGNGLSQSSPFQIANFWSVAGPGKTLCLLDGTYTGANSMIDAWEQTGRPTEANSIKGTASSPITIRAINEGKVTINGQAARRPIRLRDNDYFIIEGVNAHNSDGTVVSFRSTNGATVRRVVAWDAAEGNYMIFALSTGSMNNLLEDVAGFGIARKVFSSAGANNTTIRRAWGRWEGSHFIGPKMTYTLAYNNYNATYENIIGTWSGEKMKQTYQLACAGGSAGESESCGTTYTNYGVNQPYGIITMDRMDNSKAANSKLLGSIAYLTSSDVFKPQDVYLYRQIDAVELKNNVAYIQPGSHTTKNTFKLTNLSGATAQSLIATSLTGIGSAGSSVSSQWQTSDINEGSNLSSVASIFTNPTGAEVCKRYHNRTLTNDPLWPWPMDARIKDAVTFAGHRSVTHGMSSVPAGMEGTVTGAIESMFGPIPSQCKSGGSTTPVPTTPTPCSRYLSNTPAPSPYGLSWNWLSTGKELLLALTCDGSTTQLSIGKANTNLPADNRGLTYSWGKAYAYDGSSWNVHQPIALTCTGAKITVADVTPADTLPDYWCNGTLAGNLPSNASFFAAFTCIRDETKWQCGCTDAACTQTFWQLQGKDR